jgi:hypothetical protein
VRSERGVRVLGGAGNCIGADVDDIDELRIMLFGLSLVFC